MSDAQLDFLLAQRPPAEGYPPLLNQLEAFSRLGAVRLVDTGREIAPGTLPANLVHLRQSTIDRNEARTASSISSAGELWQFIRAVRREVRRGADAAIAYDPEAAAVLLTADRARVTCTVVHLHEHALPEEHSLFSSPGMACRTLFRTLRRADIVVVPDEFRAEDVKSRGRLDAQPLVVMNCPPALHALPDSRLLPLLQDYGLQDRPVVHFQGSIGPDRSLESIVQSMRFWPVEAVFVLVGRVDPDYRAGLLAIARRGGVENRLVFTGYVPYSQLFEYAMGATVGLTLLDADRSPNFRYSAGASNKRFEYMAMGIPQVTNRGPGISGIFEETGSALTASYSSAEDIGEKVSALIADPLLRDRMRESARAAHLATYNYENQLRPLIQRIIELSGRR